MKLVKDGRAWVIGTGSQVAWIDGALGKAGRRAASWLPSAFKSARRLAPPDDPSIQAGYDEAVVAVLRQFGPPTWWLGYLDYGVGIDIVFDDAPRIKLFGWDYVLAQAGPQQALSWRSSVRPRGEWQGALPDLIFPADHSWVLFTPWDERSSFLAGAHRLIACFEAHPMLGSQIHCLPSLPSSQPTNEGGDRRHA